MAEREGPGVGRRNRAAVADRGSLSPEGDITLDLAPNAELGAYVADSQTESPAGVMTETWEVGKFTGGERLTRIRADLGKLGVEKLELVAVTGDTERLAQLEALMGRFASQLDTIMNE